MYRTSRLFESASEKSSAAMSSEVGTLISIVSWNSRGTSIGDSVAVVMGGFVDGILGVTI